MISINNLQSKKFFLHDLYIGIFFFARHFLFLHDIFFFARHFFFFARHFFFLHDTFFFARHFFFCMTTFFFCMTPFFICKSNNYFVSFNLTLGCFYHFNSIIKVLLSEYFFTFSNLIFYFLLIINNLLFSLNKSSKNYRF
jgi:hypothetical protein